MKHPQTSKFPEVCNDFLQPSNSVPPVSSEIVMLTCYNTRDHNITEEEEIMNGEKI